MRQKITIMIIQPGLRLRDRMRAGLPPGPRGEHRKAFGSENRQLYKGSWPFLPGTI
jgi:hypothetical protein